MANLSGLGIVYRTFTASLNGLVDNRVQPYRAVSGDEELPYIAVWQEVGGMTQQAAGSRDYTITMGVLATDKRKVDALTLQEAMSRALHDRGTQDYHYEAGGPFVPLSGDAYEVQTITEDRLLDDFVFNEDDTLRFPNNGAYYIVSVTERG